MPNLENAVLAGWSSDNGDPPFVHGAPPPDDPDLGNNGIAMVRRIPKASASKHLGGSISWPDVHAEMQGDVGFVEGPNNQNPWGPEQGIAHASYCCSFACMVPYHHGYRWWPECQFGAKGDAYVPWRVKHAQNHGEWMYDHSSSGNPADLVPGDQPVFVWPGGDGAGDHIETVVQVLADGSFYTIGANTGSPQGVHFVHRDRKYLLGRIRPQFYASPLQPPAGGKVNPPYPFHVISSDIVDWPEVVGDDGVKHSWLMTKNGAVYASPSSPGVPGVNDQSYWLAPTHHAGPDSAAKLHVRQENGRFVSCVEDTEGFLFRRDGGPDFRTH